MAALRLALGQRREAVAELERAGAENSARAYSLSVDPTFDPLRDAPEFDRLQTRPHGAGRQPARATRRRSRPAAGAPR